MQKLNILVLGPKSFLSTLTELETYLKFNLNINDKKISDEILNKYEVIIVHQEYLNNLKDDQLKNKRQCIKIIATGKNNKKAYLFDNQIILPTTINEINNVIEITQSKKKFHKSSAISIKDYLLDKNEKKLIKEKDFIILTEKEIHLLEILLNSKEPISKNEILAKVWNYSSDTDTHTVETHIYRLRKKINEKFSDDNFLLNNKKGYYL